MINPAVGDIVEDEFGFYQKVTEIHPDDPQLILNTGPTAGQCMYCLVRRVIESTCSRCETLQYHLDRYRATGYHHDDIAALERSNKAMKAALQQLYDIELARQNKKLTASKLDITKALSDASVALRM